MLDKVFHLPIDQQRFFKRAKVGFERIKISIKPWRQASIVTLLLAALTAINIVPVRAVLGSQPLTVRNSIAGPYNNTSYNSQRSQVRTSDGTLHAFLQTGTATQLCIEPGSDAAGLLWEISTDGGTTWSCRALLTSDNSVTASAVVASNDDIFLTYSCSVDTTCNSQDVFFRKLTKGSGSTWTLGTEQIAADSVNASQKFSRSSVTADQSNRLWLSTVLKKGLQTSLGIGWNANNSYWLIGGSEGQLTKYDGTSWQDVSSHLVGFGNAAVVTITWNGSNWFIGGGSPHDVAVKANTCDANLNCIDVSSQFVSAGFTATTIYFASWNGTDSWLISLGNTPGLALCNANFTSCVSKTAASQSAGWPNGFGANYNGIAWNSTDHYWLLGSGYNFGTLFKYDGSAFTDLSASLHYSGVGSIAYNSSSNYFLIGYTNGKLEKVDVALTVTDLSANVTPDLGRIKSLAWDGTYWLIGGYDNHYNRCTALIVCTSVNSTLTDQKTALTIATNGNYWLMGSCSSDNLNNCVLNGGLFTQYTDGSIYSLVKYDNTVWTDETPNLPNVGDAKTRIRTYYSSDQSASPTWTLSNETTPAVYSSSDRQPDTALIAFGNKVGLVYSWPVAPYLFWQTHTAGDGLNSWSSSTGIIASGQASVPDGGMSVTVDNNNLVHLVTISGYKTNPFNLLYTNYNGSSWSAPVTVATGINSATNGNTPQITTSGSDIYVFWADSGVTCRLPSGLTCAPIVYKRAVSPFGAGNFDAAATTLLPEETFFSKVWSFKSSVWTDETADAASFTSADTTLVGSVGDYLYLGSSQKFRDINLDLLFGTSGLGGVLAWEYYNGSSWTPLILTDSYFPNLLSSSTSLWFLPPSAWQKTTVNTDSSPGYYYVRARVTSNYSRAPIATQLHTFSFHPSVSIPAYSGANIPVIYQDGYYYNTAFSLAADNLLSANVAINASPNKPSLLGPSNLVNGSFTTDPTPTLNSTLSDDNPADTLKHEVIIASDAAFASPLVDYTSALAAQGSASFTVGQATSGGTYTVGSAGQTLTDGSYYWKVRAIDNSDANGPWSVANGSGPAFRLDTTSPTTPGAPSTKTPTTITQPTWTWAAASDSGSGLKNTGAYTFEWSTDSSFHSGVSTATVDTPSYTHLTDLKAGTWYARVKATDALDQASAYSAVGQVVITAPITATTNAATSKAVTSTNPTPVEATINTAPSSPTTEKTTISPSLIDVTIALRSKASSQPLVGARVELHSRVRSAVTGQDGRVTFKQVEAGPHELKVSYRGQSSTTKILVGAVNNQPTQTVTLSLTAVPWYAAWTNWLWVLGVLTAGVLIGIRLTKQYRRAV